MSSSNELLDSCLSLVISIHYKIRVVGPADDEPARIAVRDGPSAAALERGSRFASQGTAAGLKLRETARLSGAHL